MRAERSPLEVRWADSTRDPPPEHVEHRLQQEASDVEALHGSQLTEGRRSRPTRLGIMAASASVSLWPRTVVLMVVVIVAVVGRLEPSESGRWSRHKSYQQRIEAATWRRVGLGATRWWCARLQDQLGIPQAIQLLWWSEGRG